MSEFQPQFKEALFYFNRGNALQALNRWEEAIQNYDQAITLKPDYAEAFFNRANALYQIKQWEAAVGSYDCALSIEPTVAEIFLNRGLALQELGRFESAIENYNQAITLKPDFANAYYNRGTALKKIKQLKAALESYDHAVAINPNFVDAYVDRGNILQELNQVEAAVKSYGQAIAIKPDEAAAYIGRAFAQNNLKHFELAAIDFEKAFVLQPDYDYLLGFLLHTKMKLCDWTCFNENLTELIQGIRNNKKTVVGLPLLALTYSLSDQLKIANVFSKDNYPANFTLGEIPKRPQSEKIRIGYFSADFHFHPVSILLAEVFELHDRSRFEIIAFSLRDNIKDPMRQRLEKAFDRFINIGHLQNSETASLARELNIDIAIDLGGHTSCSRPGIFAYRAAPIQVGYIGYLGTMGADYFDYLIADDTIIPEKYQPYYTEKIVYLPSYQANDSKRVIAPKNFTKKELGLPDEGFVFCSFNDNYKITPFIFDSWIRILNAVPESVLFLYAGNDTIQNNLRKEAKIRGVESERLIFGERLLPDQNLARYKVADLFLDTFPYNAGATASDALWAGLPLVTLVGETFAARMAASLLNAIELPELITHTQEAYETLAIELARDPDKLRAIKEKLAANRLTTQLFNTKLFTKHIENAYTQMAERYQSDLKPEHIYVGP